MEIIEETLRAGQKPTKAQIEEVQRAMKQPIVYSEEAPKLTPKELADFRKVNAHERKGMLVKLDPETTRVLRFHAEASHQTPAELISELVREKFAVSL